MSNLNNGVIDGTRRIGARVRDLTVDGALPGKPPGMRLRAGAVPWVSVLNYGADPTGGADSTAAFQGALNAVVALGGGVMHIPGGAYKISSTVGKNVAGASVRIVGDSKWATLVNYHGTGDCLRLYDSSALSGRTVHGGGVTHLTIDGANATGNSAGLHIGDIFQFELDLCVRSFTSGTTSKGLWLDNNWYWTEQCHGRVYAQGCTAHVIFDNSANLSGQATNSFDRAILDLFIDQQSTAYDGVVMQNSAQVVDGRIGIYGNFSSSSGTVTSAVLRMSGGGGGIISSVLDIGVEAAVGAAQSQTINFGTETGISSCTGVLDFANGAAFAPSNNGGAFNFQGPVSGDSTLPTITINGAWSQFVATGSGSNFLYTGIASVIICSAGGAVTGAILQAGIFQGQMLTVVNTSAFSITFDVSGTSHVSDGTSDVIAAGSAAQYVWDATATLWYRVRGTG